MGIGVEVAMTTVGVFVAVGLGVEVGTGVEVGAWVSVAFGVGDGDLVGVRVGVRVGVVEVFFFAEVASPSVCGDVVISACAETCETSSAIFCPPEMDWMMKKPETSSERPVRDAITATNALFSLMYA